MSSTPNDDVRSRLHSMLRRGAPSARSQELDDLMTDGCARVLTLETEKPVTKESINAAMKKAASAGPMKGVLDYTDTELVSSDFIGAPASSTFDATLTQVLGDKFAKIF